MRRSWNNPQTSSPGFVYFQPQNQTPPQNPKDAPGFLSFSDSPPVNAFSPNDSSSPQYRGSPKNFGATRRNWQHNRNRFSGRQKFYNRPNNGANACDWSFDSPSSGFSPNRSNLSTRNDSAKSDITRFIHDSFTEDPWAALERSRRAHELKDEQSSQASFVSNDTELGEVEDANT